MSSRGRRIEAIRRSPGAAIATLDDNYSGLNDNYACPAEWTR